MDGKGIVGIGEYIFQTKWEAIDTDRVMVYFVRYGENDLNESTSHKNKGIFLFSPITGQYKDLLLLAPGFEYGISGYHYQSGYDTDAESGKRNEYKCVAFSDKYDHKVHGQAFRGDTQLYAPNRNTDIDSYLGKAKEDEWIKHYTNMHQYDYKLVVSDRINGDMVIEDEYQRLQLNNTRNELHELRLRPNTLSLFNVDDVELDTRFNEENSTSSGVTTGMCLLNYEFEKEFTELSNDGTQGYTNVNARTMISYNCKRAESKDFSDASPDGVPNRLVSIFGIEIREDYQYTFTNSQARTEYYDICSTPKLAGKESGYYINPMVWEEYKIPYYPTVGSNYQNKSINDLGNLTQKFLNDWNRTFDQLYIQPPKIKNITDHKDNAREAILGIWEYRFVWDYGNGEYDAPSTTLSCPDIMWSAVKDEWLYNNYDYSSPVKDKYSGYIRPTIFLSSGYSGQRYGNATEYGEYVPFNPLYGHIARTTTESNSTKYMYGDSILLRQISLYSGEVNGTPKDLYLTEYGKRYYDLKNRLYGAIDHRFHPKLTNNDTYDISSWSYLNKGDFTTTTVLYPLQDIKFEGFVGSTSHKSKWDKDQAVIEDTLSTVLNNYNPSVDFVSAKYNSSPVPENTLFNLYAYTLPQYDEITAYDLTVDDLEWKQAKANTLFDTYGNLRLTFRGKASGTSMIPCPDYYQGVFLYSQGKHPTIKYYKKFWGPDGVDYVDESVKKNNVWTELYFNKESMDNWEQFFPAIYTDANLYVGLISPAPPYQDNMGTGGIAEPYVRPSTILKMGRVDKEMFNNYDYKDNTTAANMLIKQGTAEISIIDNSSGWHLDTAYDIYGRGVDGSDLEQDTIKGEVWYKPIRKYDLLVNQRGSADFDGILVDKDASPYWWENVVDNKHNAKQIMAGQDRWYKYPSLTIKAYLNGERYLGHEQLTQVVPSSVLFNAPRMGIKIPASKVPERAKRLLIFRTQSTHSNTWQPHQYGLVEKIDIKRATNGDAYTEIKGFTSYSGVYYFDKIKDEVLDFSTDINVYDGLAKLEDSTDIPLKSRFNLSLNDRMYYSNYEELYQPRDMRSGIHYHISSGTTGFSSGTHLSYKLMYEDVSTVYNESPTTQAMDIVQDNSVVIFNRIPIGYDSSIKQTNIYRSKDSGPYYYVGKVLPEDEGVFVDTNLTDGANMPNAVPDITTNESMIRWSEPFFPNKMKLENYVAARLGDGDQITGMASLYGNLIVFKENSMHRFAVQGGEPPISRADELSPNIGCIAPNTLINVNNTLYFLSWQGIMMYDNNQFQNIDGAFAEELQHRMKEIKDYIHDASMTYNPKTNEIMLNLPMNLQGLNAGTDIQNSTTTEYFDRQREILGHIYVINLSHGYATKYSYPNGLQLQGDVFQTITTAVPRVHRMKDGRQCIRMYYINSIGELRSSDIFPMTMPKVTMDMSNSSFTTNLYYNETVDEKAYDTSMLNTSGVEMQTTADYNKVIFQTGYKDTMEIPITVIFKSNYFTGNEENLIKRVRMNNFNMVSDGLIEIKFQSLPDKSVYNNVEHNTLYSTTEKFNSTRDYERLGSDTYYPELTSLGLKAIDGLGSNFIQIVNMINDINLFKTNDKYAKPVSYSIEIKSEKYVNINEINFYWRPIRSYLR